MEWYNQCRLCPRKCGADRLTGSGACHTKLNISPEGELMLPVARAALHFWEEPCISGSAGSGAVFFSGCSLGCVFCQNGHISSGESGIYITASRLSDIFLELQAQGALNINLVTAEHVIPIVADALRRVRGKSLTVPVLLNTSSYLTVHQLRLLDGLIDIYLPDLKYTSALIAKRFSRAADYPEVAKAAIAEMYRQSGPCVFDSSGLIKRGTIVRHLVMPGCTADSKSVVRYLYETYGDNIYISIMNQYTPMEWVSDIPLLNRRVRHSEYESVIDYALSLGVTNGFRQEGAAASTSFIPQFDHTGVLPN